jgi:thioredoxin 1
MRRSKSDDRALRAAPVDTETGELIDELITIPLDDTELSTVAAALTSIIKHFAWQGNVGVAFPAIRVDTTAEAVNETMDSFDDAVGEMSSSAFAMEAGFAADKLVTSGKYEEMEKVRAEERKKALKAKSGAARLNAPLASQSAEISTAADSRQSRLEVENYLKNAVGRDVVVMSGPEATGYGEMNFRAEKLATGTTVCVNLGKTAGIALFDNGILAHNPADVERQLATFNYPRWANAELPREENTPTDEEWKRWAMRVQHYLMRIEAVGRPDNFIIAGRASATFKYWSKHMTEVKTPFYNAEQGMNAAVLGAGKGASEILTLRRDTARVRAAIGHAKGLSPQKLDEEQLSAVFDELDEDKSGRLSLEELAIGINRLNVKLSEEEIKELFIEMDYEDTGDINKREFIAWWKDSIGNSDVEIIHTMNEYEQVLDDADGTDSLTVLMVGVTYCKPCKAFSKKYQDFADRFNGARFIKVFGNENKDMTVLCRDELKVKSTPTFYFFRNKEQVHMHTGANAGKFEKFILANVKDGEPGFGSERQFEDPVEDPKKGEKKASPAR